MKKVDVLQREEFVEKVCKILSLNHELGQGYSLGINGTWGCGKSFVLEMIEEKLSKYYFIFHYDAWKYSIYDEPLIAILTVLTDELYKNKASQKNLKRKAFRRNTKKEIKKTPEVIYDVLSNMVDLISLALGGPNIAEGAKKLKKFVKSLHRKEIDVSDFNNQTALSLALKIVQEQLVFLNEIKPVLIVVDELDRCLPEYSIKVLERIYHMTNQTNGFSIFAYDKEKLSGEILKVFGAEDTREKSEKKAFVSNYLKKFINLELRLDNGSLGNNGLLAFSKYNDIEANRLIGDDYLIKFYNEILSFFDKRTIERVIEMTHLIHEFSKKELEEDDKFDSCSYSLLIAEILAYLAFYEFGIGPQHLGVIKRESQNGEYYCLNYAVDNAPKNVLNFFQKLEDFFVLNTCDMRPDYCKKDSSTNHLRTPENTIAFFFTPKEGKHSIRIYNYGSPIPEERGLEFEHDFFQIFRKNLVKYGY